MRIIHEEPRGYNDNYYLVKLSSTELYELLGDTYHKKKLNTDYPLQYTEKYREFKKIWDNFISSVQQASLMKFYADKVQEMMDKYFKDNSEQNK
jgi:hypothetical protein